MELGFFVTAVYELMPGVKEIKEREIMALVSARAEFLAQLGVTDDDNDNEDEEGGDDNEGEAQKQELMQIIQCGGRTPTVDAKGNFLLYNGYTGPKVRIYFPDEGSAALAHRDWNPTAPNAKQALVPPCVEFSSCGGVQMQGVIGW